MRNIDPRYRGRDGRVGAGLILLLIGGGLLMREMGMDLPDWLFTWPMILILIGLYSGIKHQFRNFSWLILMGIGGAFLVQEQFPDFELRHYVWPVVFIGIGLIILVSPRPQRCRNRWRRDRWHRWEDYTAPKEAEADESSSGRTTTATQGEDHIDVVSIFGNIRKVIFSKAFRGGEVVCVFGGADINLLQADITGPIVMDIVAVFGGANLIIPADWQVRSEAVAILGGIEDKRSQQGVSLNPEKVVILRGTALFGGIEIKSY